MARGCLSGPWDWAVGPGRGTGPWDWAWVPLRAGSPFDPPASPRLLAVLATLANVAFDLVFGVFVAAFIVLAAVVVRWAVKKPR